ncbi:MAG: sigma 54-interacting transcriptional regulator [Deltaproteobacteria bacterium]|jgi:PAS domain S-box-containing protein/TyrR family helix-turn-helix protein|nr:sigma 54-interacting transcriptional regulator [Deltaproteobacteria bacterium]
MKMIIEEKSAVSSFDVDIHELINSFPTGTIILNYDGQIVHLNRQASSLISFNPQNFVGRNIQQVFPVGGKQILDVVNSNRQAAGMAIPELSNCFLQLNPISNTKRLSLILIFDSRLWMRFFGNYTTVGPLSPILSKFFDASADGISITNKNGYVLLVNKAAADNFGISKNEIQGRHVTYLLQKNICSDILTLDVLRTKKSITKLVTNYKTSSQVLATATPIFGLDGEVEMVVLNVRDVNNVDKLDSNYHHQHSVIIEKFKEEIQALNTQETLQKEMIAESPAMAAVLGTAVRLAHHGVSHVLITGETGTGKSLLAKYFHKKSKIPEKPFVHINCAALPESLLEAELFGYEKGAFTGAVQGGKAGLFEVAADGTLFLDEIGELPLSMQAKLLTILDTSEYRRIGGTKIKKAECTIIAATNQNLDLLAHSRAFRHDLLFRLQAFSLHIPPLRHRPEDIVRISQCTLDVYNEKYHQNKSLDQTSLEALKAYHFPGNIRELVNMIHQAVLLSDKKNIGHFLVSMINLSINKPTAIPIIETELVTEEQGQSFEPFPELDAKLYQSARNDVEKKILLDAMAKNRNTREMANYLGISHSTVCRKLRKYNITPPGDKRTKV